MSLQHILKSKRERWIALKIMLSFVGIHKYASIQNIFFVMRYHHCVCVCVCISMLLKCKNNLNVILTAEAHTSRTNKPPRLKSHRALSSLITDSPWDVIPCKCEHLLLCVSSARGETKDGEREWKLEKGRGGETEESSGKLGKQQQETCADWLISQLQILFSSQRRL